MLRLLRWTLSLLLLSALTARALGPHEIVLLVNAESQSSMEVANHFARLRGIPPANLVYVSLPERAVSPSAILSRDEFTHAIWEPAQAAIRERGLGDRILAWAYSADFPVLIDGDPQVSLTGITLVRNQLPDAEAIRKGTYTSRLFAGPGQDLKRRGTPGSLEQYAMRLMGDMPLPSILLAHTGSRGESTDQAIRRLQSGMRLQGAPLAGQVFFLTSDDVRTKCRSWQFEDAAAELKALGQKAQILPLAEATPASAAWGIMAGVAELKPAQLPRLVPGSMAEHLTSYAAIFEGHEYQTKMTAWLQAGAFASVGTVTEPLSIWTKFPHARMFVHYANGCTVLEALAQSMASPLQAIAIGDPLLAPWGRPQGVTLINLNESSEALKGVVEFAGSGWAGPTTGNSGLMFLIDGRSVVGSGQPPVARINTTELADGWHEIRAVIYSGGAVRHQGFATQSFTTANRGRSIRILNLASNETLTLTQVRELQVQVDPIPAKLALVRYGDVMAEQAYSTQAVYRLDPSRLGPGPVPVQVAAIYEDGEVVRSAPVQVNITRADPALEAYAPRTGRTWLPLRLPERVLDGTLRTMADQHVSLLAEKDFVLARSEVNPDHAEELAASFTLTDGEQTLVGQRMALAFDIKDGSTFSLAGWSGENGAWSLGRREAGVWKPLHQRGATLEAGHTYVLRLTRQSDGGVTLWVDGDPLLRSNALTLQGPYGVGAGTSVLTVQKAGVWSPAAP